MLSRGERFPTIQIDPPGRSFAAEQIHPRPPWTPARRGRVLFPLSTVSRATEVKDPSANMATATLDKQVRTLEEATVRFCGDSGDGMQLAGSQFTNTSALVGNDIATFPDFPAEIRAPRGTKAGVSGFQIHFASTDIYTPGDRVDSLVAMNPAALVTNLSDLVPGGVLIVNKETFDEKGLRQAGYETNPLEDGSLD